MNTQALFEVVLDVDASGRADPHYAVAAVFAVLQAPDETAALESLKRELVRAGYTVLGPYRPARCIPPDDWPRYVRSNWPAVADQLPTLDDLHAALRTSAVAYLSFYPHD